MYYRKRVDGIPLEMLGDFAHDLLLNYPQNVNVILFVIYLGLELSKIYQSAKQKKQSFFDFLNISNTKIRFPIFRLFTLLLQNKKKLPLRITDVLVDLTVLSFVTEFRDGDSNVKLALKYFKHTFSQGINSLNSTSFLVVCTSYDLFFKTWNAAERFFDELVSSFENNRKVKNWLIHLGISGVLFIRVVDSIIRRMMESTLSEETTYETSSSEKYNVSVDDFLKTLKKNTRTKYGDPSYPYFNIIIPELKKLVEPEEKEQKFIDVVEVTNIIFFKLYNYLFNDKYPLGNEFLVYILTYLTFRFFYSSLSFLLRVSLKHLDLKDKTKILRFFETLYNIFSTHREFFDNIVRKSMTNIIIKALVHHKDVLGLDIVIKELEKMRKINLSDVRMNAYKSLYDLTKNRKYLEEAINDSNAKIRSWAQKLLN